MPGFWQRFLALREEHVMRRHEEVAYLVFTIHAFQSLENEGVRAQLLPLVSLPLWHALSSGRRELELNAHSQLLKHWKRAEKKVCFQHLQSATGMVGCQPAACIFGGFSLMFDVSATRRRQQQLRT